MEDKKLATLGWGATCMSVAMYVAYIPQIIGNLEGDKGDWIQPLVASINCTLWVIYGMLYSPRDWPLAVANMPGIVFGLLAFSTALF
ncbi:hypothetical protein BK826_05330 [Rothia kristinae]|uniref:MtN3/saliva family n=1 Tax=Rothia kristinae TaxID=37923 RepID=A0A1S2N208_9MICC|nr:SemiSWEET family transporter [Rothia kristinae]OIJ36107.1 hypothetical protein BK826_05330 [Rothia kristinae]